MVDKYHVSEEPSTCIYRVEKQKVSPEHWYVVCKVHGTIFHMSHLMWIVLIFQSMSTEEESSTRGQQIEAVWLGTGTQYVYVDVLASIFPNPSLNRYHI